ncbi:hypothetical protein SB776_34235, partial [Burkholderia sp. SIMBA_045]
YKKQILNRFNLKIDDVKVHEKLCQKEPKEGVDVYNAMLTYSNKTEIEINFSNYMKNKILKTNRFLVSIILFIVVLFNACKKENTQLQVKDIKSERIKTVSANQITKTKNDDCSLLIKKL